MRGPISYAARRPRYAGTAKRTHEHPGCACCGLRFLSACAPRWRALEARVLGDGTSNAGPVDVLALSGDRLQQMIAQQAK